ncbi:MAG: Hsp20 family protein [Cytophagaceae bacterium]|nr:Hsp20 family protein [Cytophagaceae bacterium]MDW8456888.1 Hsp20 family protein [Cytophagaceae bacterium]
MLTLTKNNHGTTRFVPKIYSDLIDAFFNDFTGGVVGKNIPSVDLAEDDHNHYVSVSLPGMNKEDIKIEVKENVLAISGEKKEHKEENGKKYHLIENSYGSFYRSFRLPENANVDAIEASYVNGVLEVKIPKDEKKTSSKIININ